MHHRQTQQTHFKQLQNEIRLTRLASVLFLLLIFTLIRIIVITIEFVWTMGKHENMEYALTFLKIPIVEIMGVINILLSLIIQA